MTPPLRDANGLTPTEVRIATLVAESGIDNAAIEHIVDVMGYRHSGPVRGFIRAIRLKVECAEYELPPALRRLGYGS